MIATAERIDTRSTAYQSHAEHEGLEGMPKLDRAHFDRTQVTRLPVAEAPETSVARPLVPVPENP